MQVEHRWIVSVVAVGLIFTGLYPWSQYLVLNFTGEEYIPTVWPSALWVVENREVTRWDFTAVQALIVVAAGVVGWMLIPPASPGAKQGEGEEPTP